MTSWFFASTSETSTPQRFAAAASSIVRAAAPTWRIGMKKCRVEREPSVSWLPNLTSSPVAWATFTLAQSASISSATISGIPVRTPCPISERWQTMVTVPSGAMETKARGLLTVPCGMPSAPHLGVASASAGRDGSTCTASTRPVVERMPLRTPRRLTFSMPDVVTSSRMCLVILRSRSLLDGGANALIGPATADIAVHRAVDVGVGRMRRLLQQRDRLHDLASLAIAALRHVGRAPRLLHGMVPLRVQAFDRGDRLAVRVGHLRLARPGGVAVEM